MSDDIAIKVENLSKRYRIGRQRVGSLRTTLGQYWNRWTNSTADDLSTFWALQDVSFSVLRGEVLGVIGRNGAGKSTLLKILSRITPPTNGRVQLSGRVASLLEVGTGFHPELTGRENIFMNGALLGMSRREIQRKLDEIVDFSGVGQFMDTAVKRYSSGMYVRLAFAVAAHLEPEILLIDEVLAVGDVAFQKKCLGKMDEVARSGRTVLVVSHNMSIIKGLCTHTVFLKNGICSPRIETDTAIQSYLSTVNAHLPQYIFESSDSSIFIQQIRFYNHARQMANVFAFGEAFFIEIQMHTRIKLADFHLVVGVNDQLNHRIFTTRSCDFGIVLSSQATNTTTATMKVAKAFLTPGRYYCQFYIRSGYKNQLFHLQEEVSFEIDATAFHPNFQPHQLWGSIQFDQSIVQWHSDN